MNNPDFMPFIRAMVKLASALTNADDFESSKYFKFKVKKELNTWADVYSRMSNPLLGEFVKDSENAFQASYDQFLNLHNHVMISSKDRTNMIIMYCKMKSAMNDMDEVEYDSGAFIIMPIKIQTDAVIKAIEKQYGDILELKDSDGESIEAITKDYDTLGKTMFVNK